MSRFAASLVAASSSHPRLAILLCSLLTAAALYVTLTGLEIDTDSDRILSADLRVRQTNIALAEAFPELQNNLVVMVEAADPADARAAVEELGSRLAQQPGRFPQVFLPGDAPYYDDFGLYHLELARLEELALRVEDFGPLLATFAERPELPILLAALSQSIGGVEGLAALGADGQRILDSVSLAVESFNAGRSAPVAWEDLLFEDVAAEHSSPQLLFVRPAGNLDEMPPVLEALARVRGIARELEPRPGLRVRVTGDRAVHSEEMSLIAREALVAAAASLVLVTLILLYALESFRLLLATLLTLLAGLAWTAGFAAISVGQLNALTSAFAVLYIGLGVDFGIHFAFGYLEQRGQGTSRVPALRAAGGRVGGSLVLCALTTAIGFYAFIPTDYTGVADMGIISGSGVLLGLLATLTLLPALISAGLGESRAPGTSHLHRFEIRLPRFSARRPRSVCAVAAAVALASCATLPMLRFDTNTLNVRDPRVESVQALKDLLYESDLSVWTIEGLAPDLDAASRLAVRLEALDGIEAVRTARSFLPDEQPTRLAIFDEMRADLATPVELTREETGAGFERTQALEYTIEGYGVALDLDAELRAAADDAAPSVASAERLREALQVLLARLGDSIGPADVALLEADLFGELPAAREGVLDTLPTRSVSLADLPDELLRRYLAADGIARVEVVSATNLNEPGALEAFSDLVHSAWPAAGGPAAGTVALARAIVGSLQQALATAVAVITILLFMLMRSVKYTLIALTPLLIGTLATAAVSVLAGISLNFANIIVLPLILGIGVDSGIHLVHRHRAGLRGQEELLNTSTARAVLFSALTTIGSFSTLAFSNHLGIASLGQMLSLGIAMMLLANVVVLPAILALVDGPPSAKILEPS